MIESLMYAAVTTRPDIAFGVSRLSYFFTNPGSTPQCSDMIIVTGRYQTLRTETRRRRQFRDCKWCFLYGQYRAKETAQPSNRMVPTKNSRNLKRSSSRCRKSLKMNYYPVESKIDSRPGHWPITFLSFKGEHIALKRVLLPLFFSFYEPLCHNMRC